MSTALTSLMTAGGADGTVRAMSAPVDQLQHGIAWREVRPVGRVAADAGLPVLLLHGLGGSRISWEPQLVSLGTRRLAAAWDLPGYGESALLATPVTFAALADAVMRWADELGAHRVHLVGISFGGMIAQYTAARHGDRVASLSLLATSPKFGLDGTSPEEWRTARLAPLDAGWEPGDIADRVLGGLAGPGIAPEALEGQRAAMRRITGDALRRSIDCLLTHDSRLLLGSITAPTQCLVGSLDDETPVEYSQALVDGIAGAELHVIDGAGHLLNVEAPATVDALIAAHLERVEGTLPRVDGVAVSLDDPTPGPAGPAETGRHITSTDETKELP
jgi:3-oxoadipate enol-lactonase